MTAILELAAVSTFTCTAASTLGLSGYAHAKPCLAGIFKTGPRHHDKTHQLDAPHHAELLAGPMTHKGVQVKMNGSTCGKKPIKFNGEILFVGSAATGELEPALALGNCDVKITGSKVFAEPAPLPTIELTFDSESQAQLWAKELSESAMVGPPQDRIQELILHSVKIDKHLLDLRSRSEKVSELEIQNKKLKKDLKLVKCGFDGPEPIQKQGTSTLLAAWLSGSGSAEQEKLKADLQAKTEEMEKAAALNGKLKDKIKTGIDNPVKTKWITLVNRYVAEMKEMDRGPESSPESTEPSARPSFRDPQIPQTQSSSQMPSGRGFSARNQAEGSARSSARNPPSQFPGVQQDPVDENFQKWFMNVESRLTSMEYSRTGTSEERGRSDYTGLLLQTQTPATPSAPESVDDTFRFSQRSQQYSLPSQRSQQYSLNSQRSQPDNLDFFAAVSESRFRSLEERILSHQHQVSQDCDVLQQTLKVQFV